MRECQKNERDIGQWWTMVLLTVKMNLKDLLQEPLYTIFGKLWKFSFKEEVIKEYKGKCNQ